MVEHGDIGRDLVGPIKSANINLSFKFMRTSETHVCTVVSHGHCEAVYVIHCNSCDDDYLIIRLKFICLFSEPNPHAASADSTRTGGATLDAGWQMERQEPVDHLIQMPSNNLRIPK